MTARSPSSRSCSPPAGFTLIELLTVMAVITILLALIRPAITSMARGQGFTGSVYDVDYLIRQAKATAMAQNTFVWLGFSSTNKDGAPVLVVVAVVSRNGVSSAVPSSASASPTPAASPSSTPYQMISNPMILQGVQLDSTGSPGQTPDAYTHLAGFDSANNVDITPLVGQAGYSFLQSVPGVPGPMTFTSVIAFSPDGAANLGTATMARTIGIGLKSVPSSAATTQVAAIQISGLNGRSTLLRQ